MRNKTSYKNPSLPVSERVADLLGRMTLEEKIGQFRQTLGWNAYRRQGNSTVISKEFKNMLSGNGIGALYGVLRAGPWTGVTLKTGLSPEQGAEIINTIQRFAIEKTCLGIPLLFSEECMHGHMAIGATVFPVAIALASTWNPGLIKKMGAVIAKETRAQGGSVGYGPVLDVARDPRWSRVEETFGEDPYLCSQMGVAMVRGLQGTSLNTDHTVISTLKHFVHGVPEGGHNTAPAHMGERELREIFLTPFQSAVKAGAQSVMSSYNEIDGVPCSCNKKLLTDILRREWNFEGFVIPDYKAIDIFSAADSNSLHDIVSDYTEAVTLAVKAGVDLGLGERDFTDCLLQGVKSNRLSINILNKAVGRILRAKFLLGLFERPYVDPDRAKSIVGAKRHRQLARKIACEAIVLLKNKKSILPLKKDIKSIAVIGPNAYNIYNQLGDYTAPQSGENIVTVLDAIREKVSKSTIVNYAVGCRIKDKSKDGFPEAINAARKSDVAVIVVGGSSARDFDIEFSDTGAAVVTGRSFENDIECGEGFDRAELDLAGVQLDLIKEIQARGMPVIIVLINGRPLSINWIAENAHAILEAWYPGQEGGGAIADVLFGDYNPAGRLPVSIPKSVGQLPVYYNHKPSARKNYVFWDSEPLFSFGYGLSYTTFGYSNLRISPDIISSTGKVTVSVDVTNTGLLKGDEVVQMYIRNEVSSVTRPVRELKAFERITLVPGETKTVAFFIRAEELKFYDINMKYTIEPGRIRIMVGGNQPDVLTGHFEISNFGKRC